MKEYEVAVSTQGKYYNNRVTLNDGQNTLTIGNNNLKRGTGSTIKIPEYPYPSMLTLQLGDTIQVTNPRKAENTLFFITPDEERIQIGQDPVTVPSAFNIEMLGKEGFIRSFIQVDSQDAQETVITPNKKDEPKKLTARKSLKSRKAKVETVQRPSTPINESVQEAREQTPVPLPAVEQPSPKRAPFITVNITVPEDKLGALYKFCSGLF